MAARISYSAIIRDPSTGLGHTVVSVDGEPLGIVVKHGEGTYSFKHGGNKSPYVSRAKVLSIIEDIVYPERVQALLHPDLPTSVDIEDRPAVHAYYDAAVATEVERALAPRKAKLTVRMEDGGKVAGPMPTKRSLRIPKAERVRDAEGEWAGMHHHGGGDCMCFEDESGPSAHQARKTFIAERTK